MHSQYEVHTVSPAAFAAEHFQNQFSHTSGIDLPRSSLHVTTDAGLLWADQHPDQSGTLTHSSPRGQHPLGFKVIRQAVGSKLLLVTSEACLVNGAPALPIVVLGKKDLLSLPDGSLYAVTERVAPHFGRALAEHIAKKCTLCKLPFDAESFLVSCHCGALYHHETADTMPQLPDDDRCDCGVKLKACVVCSLPLSSEPFLTWDPSDL